MKKQLLTTIITLALGAGFVLPAQAVQSETISAGGKDMFNLHVVTPQDMAGKPAENETDEDYIADGSTYDVTQKGFYSGVRNAAQYWADMLAAGSANTKAVDFIVSTNDEENAGATGMHIWIDKEDYSLSDGPRLILQQDLSCDAIGAYAAKKFEELPGKEYAYGTIVIGKNLGVNKDDGNYGFNAAAPSQLCPIDGSASITPIIVHELAHSLGYSDDVSNVEANDGTKYVKFTATDANSFNAHLYDQNLHQAKEGMVVATTDDINKLINSGLVKSADDVFVVDNVYIDDPGQMEDTAKGKAFFCGTNVSRVLNGKTFGGVDGVPMNVWEADMKETEDGGLSLVTNAELSHIEVPRLLMTHDDYRNIPVMSELELAVLEDMGYKIDARNYFGRSIYNDGLTLVNEQGYSARNSDGTAYTGSASSTTGGIGLHLYGSHNDVTQKGDILTVGQGAAGIRVDGVGDKLTVAQNAQVRADGENGIGVLVAYGKDHIVDVKGTVTALGDSGNALQLDFGGNLLGARNDYRGSYICYKSSLDEDGAINGGSNKALYNAANVSGYAYDNSMTEAGDLLGKLATINISGNVAGKENAVYIGHSAFVDAININSGARLSGDITSDWKNFADTIYAGGSDADDDDKDTDGAGDGDDKDTDGAGDGEDKDTDGAGDGEDKDTDGADDGEDKDTDGAGDGEDKDTDGADDGEDDDNTGKSREGITIQYSKDKAYAYDAYVPELVTQLNINTDLTYDGDITGSDNMQLNVKSGTLAYSGTADVIGVTVSGGAALLGGSYKLNAQKSDEFDVSQTGTLVNHGTIGAQRPDSESTQLVIDGDLKSDGRLQFTAGGSKIGNIKVTGDADITGSTVTVDENGKYLPGTYALLQQEKTLTAANVKHDVYQSAYLTSSFDSDNAQITFGAVNNMGADEQDAFDAVMNAYNKAEGEERDDYAAMLNLNAKQARRANHALAAQKLVLMPQRSTVMQRYAGGRLQTLWNPQIKHSEVDWWLRSLKDWHYYGDDAVSGRSDSVAAGMDMNTGKESRSGVYGMYNHTKLSGAGTSALQQDWRVGAYTGKQHGGVRQYAYFDCGRLGTHYTRGVAGTGYNYDAKYKGRIAELGAEYQYDLWHGHAGSTHLAPYVNVQLSRYLQDSYKERGSVLGFNVAGLNNNYMAGELGMELRHELTGGSYSLRLGYKHVLCGTHPMLRYQYQGADANLTDNCTMDKDYLHLTLGGALKLKDNLSISGEAGWLQGAHDRDLMADVKLNWSFT